MEFLFENFDKLAEAPGGVKKLREMILQFAVQGKLVEQDPSDEPASVLLEKIKVEKEKLIAEGKIKRQKELEPIKESEIPFELPKEWDIARFIDITKVITCGIASTPTYTEKGMPFLSAKNVKPFRFLPKNHKFVSKELYKKITQNAKPEINDILLTRVGAGIGEAAIIDIDFAFAFYVSLTLIKPFHCHLDSKYLLLYLSSPTGIMNSISNIYGKGVSQGNLNVNQVRKFIVPLPPLAEQKRIVSKVDSLMVLCDDLEKQQQQKAEKKLTLNKASLLALNSSASKQEFSSHWKHITKNFDLLYSSQVNVKELKQTILQLAVQGKLVEQDSHDEPASVLLEKIKAEKERLIAEGKIKRQKELEPVRESEIPFELPKGWIWCRLGDITSLITKGSSPKWQGVQYTDENDGILFITSENVGSYKLLLNKKKYVEKKFNEIEPRSILTKNDILMNIVGASIGRVAIYNIEDLANINQAVCLIRLLYQSSEYLRFMLNFLNSEICISYMFDKQVDNARANLSMGNISKFIIPLPPLNEQKRIVEKVDYLMGLCDQLSNGLKDQEEVSERLLSAVVGGV